jgi:hypothetical protein
VLVVCGTIADCDDDEAIAKWATHILRFVAPAKPPLHLVSAFATNSCRRISTFRGLSLSELKLANSNISMV